MTHRRRGTGRDRGLSAGLTATLVAVAFLVVSPRLTAAAPAEVPWSGVGQGDVAAQRAAPPNNSFSNATVLTGALVTRLADTNIEATKQAGEPDHAGDVGGASVWYRWTPTATGTAAIDTFGSDFDTLLAAYTGGSVSGLTVVASNDDAGDDSQSRIVFTATAGTTYRIAVDGYSGGGGAATGTITLHLSLSTGIPSVSSFLPTSGPVGTSVVITGTNLIGATAVEFNGTAASVFTVNSATQITATVPAGATSGPIAVTTPGGTGTSATGFTVTVPPNDDFANAQVVSGSAVTRLGDTSVGATKEAGEPNHAENAGGASVWYRWTPATSGTAVIDTFGSAFDTLLAAYTGGSVDGLTVVASNDDAGDGQQSEILFTATAGTTYRIAVDGFRVAGVAATGTITLHLSLSTGIPSVSSFLPTSGPVGTSVVITGTNLVGATAVEFNGTAASVFTVNSDTQITATVPAGATSGPIAVTTPGGTGTSAAGFTVTALPNDDFANAQVVSGSAVTRLGDTNIGATKEAGEPNHAEKAGGASVWYRWTPATSGTAVIDTLGSDFDTLLAAYTGGSVGGLTVVASNDDAGVDSQSRILFTATAGTTYQIAVDGYNNGTGASQGSITLHVNLTVGPTVSSFLPTSGPVGTSVVITGTNLIGVTAVEFNGTAASDFSVDSATQVTATVPAGATSGPIAVTTPGGTATSSTSFTVSPTPPAGHVPGDYDGNGTTDMAVFRPSTGVWYVRDGASAEWGTAGDIPVPGDYNGDGTTDMAVFRPGSGVTQGYWYLRGQPSQQWGLSTDIPVPGDYDGDGTTDIAVFRPSTGVWYVRNGTSAEWGTSGDIPVPGDYDGDGTTDMAVFRPGSGATQGTWYVRNVTNAQWGVSTDIPVPGDYNGDGTTELAVFRPGSGVTQGIWYIRNVTNIQWGVSTDVPVPGDYDGDHTTDLAVFRPGSGATQGTWYVRNVTNAQWGVSTDTPLSLPSAIYGRFFP